MKKSFLAVCLRICTVFITVIALAVLYYILPAAVDECIAAAPEFDYLEFPCKALIYFSSIPCILALGALFMICGHIRRERTFSYQNAKLLIFIAVCAMTCVVLCIAECVILLFSHALTPEISVLAVMLCFFGTTVAVASAILSNLIERACNLERVACAD